MISRTRRPHAAFLLGLSISVLPALGPFAAALLLLTQRFTAKRRDALWAASALAFALAAWMTGGPWAAAQGALSVAGPWIVFRMFADLKWSGLAEGQRRPLGLGLLAGLGAVIVVGLATSVQGVDFAASRTIVQAIVWQDSPTLFGHTVLVLGGITALLARDDRRIAVGAMTLAALGILASGSIEAAVAWLTLSVVLVASRDAEARGPRAGEAAMLVLTVVAFVALAPLVGWGRIGFVLTPDAGGAEGRNLLTGTELPRGDWWDDRWVDVAHEQVTLAGTTMTAYEVTKRGAEPWLRLQQLVRLVPGTTYTLSGWIAGEGDAVPGFQGWGQPADGASPFVVGASLRSESWRAFVLGGGSLVDARILEREGAWQRVAVTFRYEQDAPSTIWFVGFAPDARTVEGGRARVAGLQLEVADRAGPYLPGDAAQGLPFGYARAPLWSAAWQGFQERPLFGWGRSAFGDAYRDAAPGAERRQLVPGHAHNQLLTTLFERGLVGLVGLALLLVALFGLAVRYRDLGLLSLAAAVLIANLFDATLLSGSVLYPLAAVAGWRSARRGPRRSSGIEAARQATVRGVLAATDLVAAAGSLMVASRIADALGVPSDVGGTHMLALWLWPAMAWREGLYPGYGLTPPQELRKQATATLYAGALFIAGAVLFPARLGLEPTVVAAFLATAFVAGPVARAAAKRLSHAMRLWGRPVVILGAGDTGRRVARALGRTPLDGLHPLAFFDDDPARRRGRIEGLRVRGDLEAAVAFARRHDVRHAIVAIPGLDAGRLDLLVHGHARVFRRVQFVPKLGALPASDVVATDLDGMLALEIRNGLYAPENRAAKRASDLLVAGLASALLAPLLLALWAWVRWGSAGPAFHRSERVGQEGRTFHCLKFRTMHEDAEERLHEILATDPARREEYERWHKLADDPRITRAGRFLRRTSLDELPQLWNVLKGEMSLVGPRPYLAREVADMGHHAEIIFQAKPGITGFWQVSARSSVDFAERLEMEAHYVRNWSVWWDVILLVQTPLAVLGDEGGAR